MRYRLLGYYHYPKQDMGAERNFVENAAKLALAFEKALQGILDDDRTEEELKSVIRDDTVFIFKDEDGNLYGYFTKNKTARISGVVFDKKAITQVSLKYKSWFASGETIVIREDLEPYIVANGNVTIKLLKREMTVSQEDVWFTANGSDIIVNIKNGDKRPISLPLDVSNFPSFKMKELKDVMCHYAVEIYEFDTDDECGDCDGYDYSRCNTDLCDEDCEKCNRHIRKYICNNSCFYHRYKRALALRLKADVKNSLLLLMDEILEPHTPSTLYTANEQYIEDVIRVSDFIHNRGEELIYKDGMSITFDNVKFVNCCPELMYKHFDVKLLQDWRERRVEDMVTIMVSSSKGAKYEKTYLARREDLTISYYSRYLLFFVDDNSLSCDCYDVEADKMTHIGFTFEKSLKESMKDLYQKRYEKKLKRITIKEDQKGFHVTAE